MQIVYIITITLLVEYKVNKKTILQKKFKFTIKVRAS